MIITAREFRASSRELFEKLMRPLTAPIGEHEFMRALQASCLSCEMRARYRRYPLIEARPTSGQNTHGTARSRAQLASAHRLEVSGVDGDATRTRSMIRRHLTG